MGFFKFLLKTLYSSREASKIYKKPKWYAFVIFAISLAIMIIPVIIKTVNLTYDEVKETYPEMEKVLAKMVETEGMKIEVKNGSLQSTNKKKYELTIDESTTYCIYVGFSINDVPDYNIDDPSKDNVIVFERYNIFFRYVLRNPEAARKAVPYSIYGSYRDIDFKLDDVRNYSGEDKLTYYNEVIYGMIQNAYHSTDKIKIARSYILLILEETLTIFIFGLIISFINRRISKRNYTYGKAEGMLAMMSASLLPAIITTASGFIYVEIMYIILLIFNMIKLFLMSRIQVSRRKQFDDEDILTERNARKKRFIEARRTMHQKEVQDVKEEKKEEEK